MSQSLKRKTNSFLLQEALALHDHFKIGVFPGRCRKESSPEYKQYILQGKNIQKESAVINDSVFRIVHYYIQHINHQLNKTVRSIIKNSSGFLIHFSILKEMVCTDTPERSHNLTVNKYRNDNY